MVVCTGLHIIRTLASIVRCTQPRLHCNSPHFSPHPPTPPFFREFSMSPVCPVEASREFYELVTHALVRSSDVTDKHRGECHLEKAGLRAKTFLHVAVDVQVRENSFK